MNPDLPSRIGKVTKRPDIYGRPMQYTVLDEIVRVPESNKDKAIYLQRLEFQPTGRIQLRLCYYMIGQKGRGKGKWLWGQYATMIDREDLEAILASAREKGWIS